MRDTCSSVTFCCGPDEYARVCGAVLLRLQLCDSSTLKVRMTMVGLLQPRPQRFASMKEMVMARVIVALRTCDLAYAEELKDMAANLGKALRTNVEGLSSFRSSQGNP